MVSSLTTLPSSYRYFWKTSRSPCFYMLLQPRLSPISMLITRDWRCRERRQEIKVVNLADDTNIFRGSMNYFARINPILMLYEKVTISEISKLFKKSRHYQLLKSHSHTDLILITGNQIPTWYEYKFCQGWDGNPGEKKTLLKSFIKVSN